MTQSAPNQEKSEPIYLLVTDLAASNPRNWKVPSFSSSSIKLSLYHFAPFKHWAIQVRGYCYEVNARLSAVSGTREFFLNNRCPLPTWQQTVHDKNLAWDRVEVGATTSTDDDISDKAELIWKDRFTKKYKLDKQNCQNFSYLLYKCIAVEPEKIKNDMRRSWKRMPRRFSDLTSFAKSCATSSIARAILFETLADGVVLGAEVLGLEAALGLEIAGIALLGPIGEVIFGITIVALILKKSRDKKWLKKLKRFSKKDRSALEHGDVEDQSEAALNEQAALILNEIAHEAKSSGGRDGNTLVVPEWELGDSKLVTDFASDPPQYELLMPEAEEYAPPLPPRPKGPQIWVFQNESLEASRHCV